MPGMTEKEADALDEYWTKNTPKLKKDSGGFFTERRTRMLLLDEATISLLNIQAKAVNQTPTEFITQLIHKGATAAM